MSFHDNNFKQQGNTQAAISKIQKEQKKIAKLDQINTSINIAISMCDANEMQDIKSSLKIIEKKVIDKKKKLEKSIQNESQSIVNIEKTAYQTWWDNIKKGLQVNNN
jgi:cob(I)alamin adenosyltransferase